MHCLTILLRLRLCLMQKTVRLVRKLCGYEMCASSFAALLFGSVSLRYISDALNTCFCLLRAQKGVWVFMSSVWYVCPSWVKAGTYWETWVKRSSVRFDENLLACSLTSLRTDKWAHFRNFANSPQITHWLTVWLSALRTRVTWFAKI
jgi:hypothetical protein